MKVFLQYILPKHLITIAAGKLANIKGGKLTAWVIKKFVNSYNVNMSEAANSDTNSYATFNDFFVRELKSGARPLADSKIICPVDGAISQLGPINNQTIIQAKNHNYTTNALLANNAELAKEFDNGSFATIYLSPKDYHRIHMPCAAKLISMQFVPGQLFSVNPLTAENVPSLFARNERLVCEFESDEVGKFVMVLVGATIVGSMATVWHGLVKRGSNKQIQSFDYSEQNISFNKGDEMGRFLLGSTVILLFKQDQVNFDSTLNAGTTVRLGQNLI